MRDCHVDLAPVGVPPTLVSVKVPLEISDERVASILKEFGKVDSHVLRRKYHFVDIETGIRVFKLENVTTRLPSFLLIEGCTLPVYTRVAGQPPTCYRCGSPTHFIRDCPPQHGLRGSPSNISEHLDERNSRSPQWRIQVFEKGGPQHKAQFFVRLARNSQSGTLLPVSSQTSPEERDGELTPSTSREEFELIRY